MQSLAFVLVLFPFVCSGPVQQFWLLSSHVFCPRMSSALPCLLPSHAFCPFGTHAYDPPDTSFSPSQVPARRLGQSRCSVLLGTARDPAKGNPQGSEPSPPFMFCQAIAPSPLPAHNGGATSFPNLSIFDITPQQFFPFQARAS
jgi:hypothetical protein